MQLGLMIFCLVVFLISISIFLKQVYIYIYKGGSEFSETKLDISALILVISFITFTLLI